MIEYLKCVQHYKKENYKKNVQCKHLKSIDI